ncbi:hypothetical protein [Kitasatospora sp. NPDC057223]|uniref:hypothetical protein n=1 Tax=Kitasatospora sp. NPDC057223 TaxID=3346055 RepID=UPI0036261497
MTRHLAPVPSPGDGPHVDMELLAALVAAQLNTNQTNTLLPAPPPAHLPVQQAPVNPVVQRYGGYLAMGAGAAAVLIPVLLATTAALLAAGMGALALAISALVIRWIIRDMRQH